MKIRIIGVGSASQKCEHYVHTNQPCRISVLQVRKIAGNLEVDWIRQFRNHVTFKSVAGISQRSTRNTLILE